ncbi:MAG TPA: hypothetical protein VLZ81_03720 [Blastocatellia bacterium]|nr:hypothetical protein [Blastocatellia bacterium]
MSKEIPKGALRFGAFLVLVACAVTFTVSRVVHSGNLQRQQRGVKAELTAADKIRLRKMLMDGVGSSVSLPTEGARAGQVEASISSMSQFIKDRSGLELSPEVTSKLASIEQRTLDGNANRISCDDLSDSMLGVVVERFRHCTDAEIEKAADALGNVKTAGTKAGDSTDAPKNMLMLRANGQGVVSRAEFVESAKRYRTLANVPAQLIALVGIVRPLVRQTFQARMNTLSQALPEQWGDAPAKGLTPARAFLLAYSVVGDDTLGRSMPDLKEHMKWAEGARGKADPSYQPSTAGTPYGSNGSLFSSPVNLIFTRQTSLRLLDKIAERTSK